MRLGPDYRLLVEAAGELHGLLDAERRFVYVNPIAYELFGGAAEELVGVYLLEIVHDEDRPRAEDALRSAAEDGLSPALTARFRRADGTYLWLEMRIRALRGEHGGGPRFVTSARDVSEHIRVLAEVSEREATLRSVIASFDDLVFVFDLEGRFREYYQPGDHRDLYVTPEQFLGRHFSEVLPEDVAASLANALDQARAHRTVGEAEHEMASDGAVRHFHAKVSPMTGPSGVCFGFVGVVRDITSQRLAEQARLASLRATERAERLEGLAVLARGSAHEYNNLLAVIQGNLSLALDELRETPLLREELSDAMESAKRAAEVTRRLLTFAGEHIGRQTTLDPRALVRGLEETLRERVPASAELQIDLDPDIPFIEGDRKLVEKALCNLVQNSLEALPEGVGTLRLRVQPRECSAEELAASRVWPLPPPGLFAAFEIDDSGAGIEPELLHRLFDPFVSTRFLGRGLGLAEVAGIMRAHVGACLVESEPGTGTCVTLLFPRSSAGRDLRA